VETAGRRRPPSDARLQDQDDQDLSSSNPQFASGTHKSFDFAGLRVIPEHEATVKIQFVG
jgi:hypothetical protein